MDIQGEIDRAKYLIENSEYLQSYRILYPIATSGYSDAQVLIGNLYLAGHGVDQDHATALKWYHMAAKQGSPFGHFWISILSKKDQPNEYHFSMARTLFLSRANLGDSESQYWLGLLFTLSGEIQDAIYWYQRAAEVGHIGATNNLIGLYCYGIPERGIEPNLDKASKLYAVAKKDECLRFDFPELEQYLTDKH